MLRLFLMAGLLVLVSSIRPSLADLNGDDQALVTLEELDQRCQAAREKKIAPLRSAEIAHCKASERNDPEFCERFWRDYGESTVTADGVFVPRMFWDLPACVTAFEERRRRASE
jgi:hypothetical protein